jgi:iron complex transport system ATP-binding protein
MSILSIKNLSFSYDGKTKVLDNISFDVDNGSIFAVLGKNGCGKSTLLDCILGINDYKTGIICVDNKDIKDYSIKEFARKVAYISQNTVINIDYTVRDFLLFGRTPHLQFGDKFKEEDYKIVDECSKKCEISHLLNKDINKISGGERQLAFICRALVQDADLFIFDEPTASLDFGNQYKLFDIMKDIASNGKTVIFTTHNPNQLLEIEAKAVVIDNHYVYSTGKARDIIDGELLKKIYGFDFVVENNIIHRI